MKLGLIGCGKMGSALVVGALKARAVEGDQVVGFDVVPAAVANLAPHGVQAATSIAEVAKSVDVLLLCTKPFQAEEALREIAGSGSTKDSLLIVSVAAGLTVETLESAVGAGARIIRCMPNTPALIGKGAAAFTRGNDATNADAETAQALLGAVGIAVEVREDLIDAVTGLSGSGPAYVYLFIEALIDGGVQNGLPRDQARQLAIQTVLGGAAMVQETGEHPAVLKDMVTSPGGTTMAALEALEAHAFRAACIDAVNAATEKAREMGRS